MNYFTLDDVDNLVISGRTRLDNTAEYDISYYENYINENIKIIGELIINVIFLIDSIKDEKTKSRLIGWSKLLITAYQYNVNKQPKQEFANSKYSKSSKLGYSQIHKYAYFIERDFVNLVKSYSNIIDFMNNVYFNAKVSNEKGTIDSNTLYDIFIETKKSCSKLGIHCPDSQAVYDAIVQNSCEALSLDMDLEEVEENITEDDILINSLPYTVTAPEFTYDGPRKIEIPANNPKAKVSYTKRYLQHLSNKPYGK